MFLFTCLRATSSSFYACSVIFGNKKTPVLRGGNFKSLFTFRKKSPTPEAKEVQADAEAAHCSRAYSSDIDPETLEQTVQSSFPMAAVPRQWFEIPYVTFVGDAGVGKSTLLQRIDCGIFADYIAFGGQFLEPQLQVSLPSREQELEIKLQDTQGHPDYERYRPLMYPHTSSFVLCYSVSNSESLANVRSKWLPELQRHIKKLPPCLLLGMKSDLPRAVRESEVAEAARGLPGKLTPLECSALTGQGLEEVLQQVALAIVQADERHSRNYCCRLT